MKRIDLLRCLECRGQLGGDLAAEVNDGARNNAGACGRARIENLKKWYPPAGRSTKRPDVTISLPLRS
jgi:hypothetical protein